MKGRPSFLKRERLLNRFEFDHVMARGGKKRVDNCFILFWLANELEYQRLGIIASRKIGNACVRNRAKRRLREIFRHVKDALHPHMDIVVIAGKGMVSLPYAVLEKKFFESLPAVKSF
jgi:ribonuclease P protein component